MNTISKIFLFILVCIFAFGCGILYDCNVKLNKELTHLKSIEHKIYLDRINKYIPPEGIKFKTPKDWRNRLNG